MCLITPYPKKWGGYILFDKLQISYKHDSIVFFKSHGPQRLNTSVLMVLFESFGHVCDPKYSKTNHFGIVVVQD